MKLSIKPLSVNAAYRGRRFSTKSHLEYSKALERLLGPLELKIEKGDKLAIEITFGCSNSRSDLDNFAKVFIDALQDKYDFNDSQIYELHLYKEIARKSMEYIEFEILKLDEI